MERRSRTSRLNHLKLKAEKLIILGFSAFFDVGFTWFSKFYGKIKR